MRTLTAALAALLLLIQYPLWIGQGGWFRVAELRGKVQDQTERVGSQGQRNAKLGAEVQSLREGRESVEERGRVELHMIKSDEIYIQVLDRPIGAGIPSNGAPAEPK